MITHPRKLLCIAASFALACTLGGASSAFADDGNGYVQRNLISDGFLAAEQPPDTNLVNAWGLAFNPFGPAWVADNGTGLSTLYDGNGVVKSLVVQIPTPTADSGGTPTGIVFNASTSPTSFAVTGGPSHFLFATEDGVIAGWPGGTQAFVGVDSSPAGAVYKGIALGGGGSAQMLYATDFHNARVDVFDATFQPVTTLPAGAFTDPQLPSGYAPFGIQAIGGDIFVTYAK
ncbi:MAG TPA: TIGR03118 family protein, partial [Rudaea sp.]|nr:TIGR03118 family protein [Rudaea sp.]